MFVSKLKALHETFRLRPTRSCCASFECSYAATLWRRISSRPALLRIHGGAFCFPDCFERELIRRLKQVAFGSLCKTESSRRVPLGLLMLSRGQLTSKQLRQALELQKSIGTYRIGECLQQLGFARDQDIAAALAMQWSCPLIKAVPAAVSDCAVPFYLLQKFQMVPVHFSGVRRVLHIAFAEKIEYEALFSIEQILGCKTEACLTTPNELAAALERYEEPRRRGEKLFESTSDIEETSRIISSHVSTMCAGEIRVTSCGDLFWARILGRESFEDLLFRGVRRSVSDFAPKRLLKKIPG